MTLVSLVSVSAPITTPIAAAPISLPRSVEGGRASKHNASASPNPPSRLERLSLLTTPERNTNLGTPATSAAATTGVQRSREMYLAAR